MPAARELTPKVWPEKMVLQTPWVRFAQSKVFFFVFLFFFGNWPSRHVVQKKDMWLKRHTFGYKETHDTYACRLRTSGASITKTKTKKTKKTKNKKDMPDMETLRTCGKNRNG